MGSNESLGAELRKNADSTPGKPTTLVTVLDMATKRRRQQLYAFKGNRCSACGRTVQEMLDCYGTFDRLFEFNHIDPALKHPDYDNLIRRVISTEQLDELDKCVLLCRQCHGIVHAQTLNGKLDVTVRLGSRVAKQQVAGQLIVNRRSQKVTFLTADRLLTTPYRVKIGTARPKLFFGTELNANNTLYHMFQDLPQTRRLRIEAWRSQQHLLTAEHVDKSCYHVTQSVRCDLLSLELCEDSPESPVVWVRNGLALTKTGEVIDDAEIDMRVEYSQPTSE